MIIGMIRAGYSLIAHIDFAAELFVQTMIPGYGYLDDVTVTSLVYTAE